MYRYLTNNGLSALEVEYWKRIFYSNLKIGVELECEFRNTSGLFEFLRDKLKPTRNVTIVGEYGVEDVKSDGSLSSGAEVCTTGRRIGFADLYNQYKAIMDVFFQKGAYVSPRAGMHNHILLDYNDNYNSLEKNVPGIILKNILQLIKFHMPELVWITSTLRESNGAMTRMKRFCNHDTLVETSMAKNNVKQIKDKINNERYKFVNLYPMQCNAANLDMIQKFHFEFRFPDCSIYPAQIAAQNILYAAIIIKAVEASETGLLSCGSNEEWNRTKELIDMVRTDADDMRRSRPINDDIKNELRNRAMNMIKALKPQISFVDAHAYGVLNVLAVTPISQMGDTSDRDINQSFDDLVNNIYDYFDSDYEEIIHAINTMSVINCNSEADWNYKFSGAAKDKSDVSQKIFNLKLKRNLRFDKELGTYIF